MTDGADAILWREAAEEANEEDKIWWQRFLEEIGSKAVKNLAE